MHFLRLFALSLIVPLFAACSPKQEWRSVPLPDLGLQASLPCKPQKTEREVELAGRPLQVVMQGCEAGHTTYAIACATLTDPSLAGMTLTHWRAAVLAAAHARDLNDTPFQPPGALGLPQSLRTSATGTLPGGDVMHMDAAWFSRLQGDTVRACYAIAYGRELTAATADVFVNALTLE